MDQGDLESDDVRRPGGFLEVMEKFPGLLRAAGDGVGVAQKALSRREYIQLVESRDGFLGIAELKMYSREKEAGPDDVRLQLQRFVKLFRRLVVFGRWNSTRPNPMLIEGVTGSRLSAVCASSRASSRRAVPTRTKTARQ